MTKKTGYQICIVSIILFAAVN